MRVPFVSFIPMEKELDTEIRAAFDRVLSNSWYIDGEEDKAFEKAFSDYVGTDYCVGVGNGLDALMLALKALEIGEGDEVIVPSNTYIATALAVTYVGAKPVFVEPDIRTYNINPDLIEAAITDKTKAIVAVHYAGVSCEMDTIMEIARRHGLKVIEDAAQGVMSTYKGRALGTIGDFGCYSFHETKNYSMGEGGALVLNHREDLEPAEILREKGTDRSRFLKGMVDKYTWVDIGDSYLPSELNAAYLWGQLQAVDVIEQDRMCSWNMYYESLKPLANQHHIELPNIPSACEHNAHMFYIKAKNLEERTRLIEHLKKNEILSVFHYIPLHSSPAGIKYGRFHGEDVYTTKESERLVRLPLYFGLTEADCNKVIKDINDFYSRERIVSN